MSDLKDAIPKCENCNSVKNLYLKTKAENEKLRNVLRIAKLLTEDDRSRSCRFDHNGNCQEHSWFDLENENCPVKELKETLEELK